MIIVNPPPLGAYLFQVHLRWGGGGGGLFNLEKTMVSVLHRELEYGEEIQVQDVLGRADEDQNQIRTSSW